MGYKNLAIVMGKLGKTPEIHKLENGSRVTTISLCTEESYVKKGGERVKTVNWHHCVLWGNLCDLAEKFLSAGDTVMVQGKMRTRTWHDKNKGHDRSITEVLVDDLQLVKTKGKPNHQNAEEQIPPMPEDMDDTDGMPF